MPSTARRPPNSLVRPRASISGGGGLIQLPALLILRSDLPTVTLLGSNKLAAVTGTTAAAVAYNRRVRVPRWLIAAGVPSAAAFALIGARVATVIDEAVFKPLVLVLLIAVALYTFTRKHFGAEARVTRAAARPAPYVALICAAMGFYDGVFGPGTGSLLMFLFVGVLGLDFLNAAAATKIINVTTNLFALISFMAAGHVFYQIAIPMGLCNIAGGIVGSRLAIKRGSAFVRVVFLAVVVGVIARYAYEILVA